jgi:hypothetical protein
MLTPAESGVGELWPDRAPESGMVQSSFCGYLMVRDPLVLRIQLLSEQLGESPMQILDSVCRRVIDTENLGLMDRENFYPVDKTHTKS